MSVEIEPFELSFQQPFTVEISRTLRIKNPNQTPIAFKVKTTAPKQYCVRPNSGRVEPGQDVEAMKQEPAPGTKCRDKFLVQSAPITGDKEFASIASVLETSDKSSIQERKIRVNWITSSEEGASAPGPAVTPSRRSVTDVSTNDTPDVSRTFSSPGEDARSGTSPAPPSYRGAADAQSQHDAGSDHDQSTVSAATAAVSHTVQLTYEEIKAKLQQAEAKIIALQEGGGLRQRVKAGTEKLPSTQEAAAAVRQNVDGVSVQIVALLCLLSFLLAYFFF
ncbi:phosphatidylinositol-binding protein scs2 [Verticillium nonalfalfae]|uniref:Phosphatidylinositol-binding protein scs2 n=1 Tax=Verticillium nonalfalfae TaxID=1051616 RepID=A0A3M9YCE6_9PEZI|nr:phosphatidylinositol-binding protein scs2 [Verticillium nonalfalfae]RNJ58207.1 phosphatidylinositol-binding protein scs2 [Verticillium nonalfalfae]